MTTTARTPKRSPQRELSRLTLIRVGTNEALARRADQDHEPTDPGERLPFACECEGERCRDRLLLRRSDYEHTRSAGWLIVAPGHQISGTRIRARLDSSFILERTV